MLSPDQERTLLADIASGASAAQQLIDSVERTHTQTLALKRQVRHAHRARELFLAANLRLVMSIARRYTGRGLEFDDLVQEGVTGMIHALNKFDNSRGLRFSTYATHWIRQHISRAVVAQGSAIRLPEQRVTEIGRLTGARRTLTLELGREPDDQETAAATGLSLEAIRNLDVIAQAVTSLDKPVGEDGATLAEFMTATSPDASTLTESDDLVRQVSGLLSTLTDVEHQVIAARYGLAGRDQTSTDVIAIQLGLSREQVRTIEGRALRRLRHPRNNHLHDYLGS